MLQYIFAPVPVLLINHCPQLPQYPSYWHTKVHYCPIKSPIDTMQYTSAPVPVLLIRFLYVSPLLARNQSYSYRTVHYYEYQSYWYQTVHYIPSICSTNTLHYSIAPLPVLMIRRYSLLTQFQSDKKPSIHYCPSTTNWYDIVLYCPSTSPTDTLQPISAPVPVLLIYYSPLLPQYQSYWYPTIHCCQSTSPVDTIQSTTAPVRAVLLPYSQILPQYQSYW